MDMTDNPILQDLRAAGELFWLNPEKKSFRDAEPCGLTAADIDDAEARLLRFAPCLKKLFPETAEQGGLIESPLRPIPAMEARLKEKYGGYPGGRLLLKMDSHLAAAGSVKARGGIYEVLRHAEDLALKSGLLAEKSAYSALTEEPFRSFFSRHTIQVGSTGNLGLSIGIMSAALGFRTVVHMSSDARQWKKDLLRAHGVTVAEYADDYSAAVAAGRALSAQDPDSYFVDDEKSQDLFLGYAVAARRLKGQLAALDIYPDEDHPLFVYIPCGVGGAPGGITFGLKETFGDCVHAFFAEPVQAPCMVLGLATGLGDGICVGDIGLTGKTHADGLAVGRPSALASRVMRPLLSGEFTVEDAALYNFLRDLHETEGIFIEPSACAAFAGPARFCRYPQGRARWEALPETARKNAVHIVWATGGSLVPPPVREEYLNTWL